MPQLDITAYFSEYLWTVLSFFTLYYFLSKSFLPEFARALRFEEIKYTLPKDTFHVPAHSLGKVHPLQILENGKTLLHEECLFLLKGKGVLSRQSNSFSNFSETRNEVSKTIPQKIVGIPHESQGLKKKEESLNDALFDMFEE